jgi:hypothetical protein
MPEIMDEDLRLACSCLTWSDKRAAYAVAYALWLEAATMLPLATQAPLAEEARRCQTPPLDAAKPDERTA